MASLLKVDTLQDTSGGALSFGKVLQVVDVHNTNYVSQAFSSNTPTNVTNMSASITPTSSSSKIFIQVQWCGESSRNDMAWNGMWGIKRGTTLIGQPTSTGNTYSGYLGIYTAGINYHADNASSTMEFVKFDYLDSPATTSALTYYAYFTCGSAQTLKHGGTYSWSTSRTTGYERGTYGMRVWEIGS